MFVGIKGGTSSLLHPPRFFPFLTSGLNAAAPDAVRAAKSATVCLAPTHAAWAAFNRSSGACLATGAGLLGGGG